MELRYSYLEVNTEQLCKNMQTIEAEQGARVIPVLKCDAYGLGLVPVARALADGAGARAFAVAQLGEALALREAGLTQDILLLAALPVDLLAPAIQLGIQLCAHSPAFVQATAEAAARLGRPALLQIKVDTGLNRLGVRPGPQLQHMLALLRGQPLLRLCGVYSHFIDGEQQGSPLARQQLAQYLGALGQVRSAGLQPGLRHISNSGASEWFTEAALDAVRIGRRLFTDHPTQPRAPGSPGAVGEVASWRTAIVHLRQVAAGDALGYDQAVRAQRPTTLAVLPVGYGDGLDERLGPLRAPLLVGKEGRRARYLSLCMDQSLVDVTGLGCAVGEEVTLLGHTSGGAFLSANEVMAGLHTDGVTLLSRIGPRVARRYT